MVKNNNLESNSDDEMLKNVQGKLDKLEKDIKNPNQTYSKVSCSQMNKSMFGYASRNQDLNRLFNKQLKYDVDVNGDFINKGNPFFSFVPFEDLGHENHETKIGFLNHGRRSLQFEDFYSVYIIANQIIESPKSDVNNNFVFF